MQKTGQGSQERNKIRTGVVLGGSSSYDTAKPVIQVFVYSRSFSNTHTPPEEIGTHHNMQFIVLIMSFTGSV